MKNFSLLSLAVCLLMLAAACKKKGADPGPSRTDMLTAKAWKITAVKANNTPLTADLLNQVSGQAGLLGQIYSSDVLFKADGTFAATNRTTGAVTAGTWAFNADETQLKLVSGMQTVDFKVEALTSANLTLMTMNAYTVTLPVIGTQSFTVALELVPA